MLQFLPRCVPSRGLGDRKRALDSPPIEPGRRIVELEIQLPLALRDEGALRPACVAAFAKARRRKDDIVRVAEPRTNGDWRRFGEEGPAHPVSAVAVRETPAIAFSNSGAHRWPFFRSAVIFSLILAAMSSGVGCTIPSFRGGLGGSCLAAFSKAEMTASLFCVGSPLTCTTRCPCGRVQKSALTSRG